MIKTRQLFKLLKMTQPQVKKYAKRVMKSNGYKPISGDGYLFGEGNIPIMLVAHMDTVFNAPPKTIYNHNGVLSGSNGLGADDRAGVYSVLDIISDGYRPYVLFTEDEEIGCIGATKYARDIIPADLMYIIELDRRGQNDCVFYSCDNADFVDYVEQFGFKENYGSYSDICEIAPAYGVSAVNLSIGYYQEHTKYETLVLDNMEATIGKVKNMLEDCPDAPFEYIEYVSRYRVSANRKWSDSWINSGDTSTKDNQSYDYYSDPYGAWDITLTDCFVNLPDKSLIDIEGEGTYDYKMDEFDNIWHFENEKWVRVAGAVALSYNFKEMNYDDLFYDAYNKGLFDNYSQGRTK